MPAGTIIIEGPAGKGKSRLPTVAGDMAREAGMQVLGAAASELEREFPLGVAVQLFEPRWGAADADERRALLDGPAGSAGALLERGLFEAAPWPGDQAVSADPRAVLAGEQPGLSASPTGHASSPRRSWRGRAGSA